LKPFSSLLIVGQFDPEHTGFHFFRAAKELNLPHSILDDRAAKSRFSPLNRLAWNFRDKSYWNQKVFQKILLSDVESFRPSHLLVIGSSAIFSDTLIQLNQRNIVTTLFVTDDPWNVSLSSRWFFDSLKHFHLIATPRKSNLAQLRQHCNSSVFYLPFGYNPEVHFEEKTITQDEKEKYGCDIMFFGGADSDRYPYIKKLISEGFKIKLYGGYWEKDPITQPYAMGILGIKELRKAVKASKISLNLVRRANRDGHVMRSFEIPAMGGCPLNEATEEHREIFGSNLIPMFQSEDEMLQLAKQLLASNTLRAEWGKKAQTHVVTNNNTYRHRLETLLSHCP
jgi:spore maturation protein CgeB